MSGLNNVNVQKGIDGSVATSLKFVVKFVFFVEITWTDWYDCLIDDDQKSIIYP